MAKAEELRYTKTHEWIAVDGETATVGVSEHAQREMGDIVFVEFPKNKQELEKEKPCAVIESVKSAFDIYSPVSGQVTETNNGLASDPALINNSPLEKGWLFKVKLSNPEELNELMSHDKYLEFISQNA